MTMITMNKKNNTTTPSKKIKNQNPTTKKVTPAHTPAHYEELNFEELESVAGAILDECDECGMMEIDEMVMMSVEMKKGGNEGKMKEREMKVMF